MNKVIINIDGASRGNPGPAAIGVIIRDDKGNVLSTISRAIGKATNNQAEYRAIIAALEKAESLGIIDVAIRSDSELLVKQMKGRYKVRNTGLIPLFERAKQLQGKMKSFSITHVPREQNSEADALANRAFR